MSSVEKHDPSSWPVAAPPHLVEGGHLRLGTLVAFFLPGLFREHADAVRTLFDYWLTILPPDALRSAVVGASSKRLEVTSKVIDRCRAQLTDKNPDAPASFSIEGPEETCPRHSFAVSGLAHQAADVALGHASSVQVRFPWGTSFDSLLAFAKKTAELLQYTSGFASPALWFDGQSLGDPGRARAARLAAKHPGLELSVSGWALGDRCHGAHWLTYLGPKLVEALGGASAIEAAITPVSEEATVEPAGHGVRVRASMAPTLGNMLQGAMAPGLRAVAAVLRPVTADAPKFLREAGPRTTLDLEDGEGAVHEAFAKELGARWSERFFEDGMVLAGMVAKLDHLDRAERDVAQWIAPASAVDDAKLAAFLTDLTQVPYVSGVLGEGLLQLLRASIDRGDEAVAARITKVFPAVDILTFARRPPNSGSGERIDWLMANDPQARTVDWLLRAARRDAEGVARARPMASFGARVVEKVPSLATKIVEVMPDDTDDYSWKCLLSPINNLLGELRQSDLAAAERLCDDIQPIAHHHPSIFLWTATIYIARKRVDEAMKQIERAFAHGYKDLARIKREKDFAVLFDDPRFAALG